MAIRSAVLSRVGSCLFHSFLIAILIIVVGCSEDPTSPEGDGTPPSTVTDLTVSSKTAKSVTLTWTAPGDDGVTGKARQFDIRYSIRPINLSNWDSAALCDGEPTPGDAGGSEAAGHLHPG